MATSPAAPHLALTTAPSHRGSWSRRCHSRRKSSSQPSGNSPDWNLGMTAPYGFKPSFNRTFVVDESPTGWWITPYHFGIDQGPVVLMIENYRSGLVWDIMRRCPAMIAGLRRAGFTGGWL